MDILAYNHKYISHKFTTKTQHNHEHKYKTTNMNILVFNHKKFRHARTANAQNNHLHNTYQTETA